jgi:hypothetical protein
VLLEGSVERCRCWSRVRVVSWGEGQRRRAVREVGVSNGEQKTCWGTVLRCWSIRRRGNAMLFLAWVWRRERGM